MPIDVETKGPGSVVSAVLATAASTTPTIILDPIVITPVTGTTVVLKDLQLDRVGSAYISLGFGHADTLAAIVEGNPTAFTLGLASSGITNGETFSVILAGIVQTGGVALDLNGGYPSTGKSRATATGANTFTITTDTTARTYDVSAATVTVIREQIYTEQATLATNGLRAFQTSNKKLYVLGDGAADGRCNLSSRVYDEIAGDEATLPPTKINLRAGQNLIRSNGAICTADAATVFRTLLQLGTTERMLITKIGLMRGTTNEVAVGYADDAAGLNFVVLLASRGPDYFPAGRWPVPAGKFILVRNIKTGAGAKIACGYFEGETMGKDHGQRIQANGIQTADAATTFTTLRQQAATESRVIDRLVLLNLDLAELSIGYADDAAGLNFVALRWTGSAGDIIDDTGDWAVPVGKFILLRGNSLAGAKWGSGWIDSYRTA